MRNASGAHPSGQRRPLTFGGDSRYASYPVDDVHQAELHTALGDGDDFWRQQKRDRLTDDWQSVAGGLGRASQVLVVTSSGREHN